MIPGLKLIDDVLKGLPENARLRDQLGELRAQIQVLQNENEELKAKVDQLTPKPDALPPKASEILQFFFSEAREMSTYEVASSTSLAEGVCEAHCDNLRKRGFIRQCRLGGRGRAPMSRITAEGRKYVMNHHG